ncbi:MAG: hypothetical protein IJI68_12290 [Eggerthellaceae bacterium]|nr:hypothetical protein [Eggerthellaceae bacterium]
MGQTVDQKQIRLERAIKLSEDVLNECRIQLMLKFRFLDLALWRMASESTTVQGRYALATDGKKVYYEPISVLHRFDDGFNEMVRDYLHMVMHCIFRHPFDKLHDRHDAWWLACDVIAESVALEICGGRFESELDKERRGAVSELRLLCGTLTPGRLYGLFLRTLTEPAGSSLRSLSESRMNEFRALFERDNHEAWPSYAKAKKEEVPGDVEELAKPDPDSDESIPEDSEKEMVVDGDAEEAEANNQELSNPESAEDSHDADEEAQGSSADADDVEEGAEDSIESDTQGSSSGDEDDDEVEDEKSQEERDWEEIAKQIEMNLETFSKEWGEEAGSLIASLSIANRKRYDYTDFLRRFAVLSEEMKINDDEYDYVFYTYGLKLYGNMPLVEPLEYKETQRIRDFVICIDTSESCRGDLVKKFVEHTFNVIKKSEDYAHEVNIHIVQCDAKVQSDTKITDLKDVDGFMDGFFIRGMGGTDFRPAFAYVNQLKDRGELPDMKGLIYFTDGLGQFPDKAPDYDTAFVFMDEGESDIPKVPPWAMRVLIDEEGINRFRSEL